MTTIAQNDMRESLTYEAPFLIEKLLKLHIVETAEEGEALFLEVKRFLVAAHSVPPGGAECSMYSLLVDEAWHQFVLFTFEYSKFAEQYYGKFVHHNPGNAPKYLHDDEEPSKTMTLAEFEVHYQALFGIPLPDVWYDERNVRIHRRLSKGKAVLSVVPGEEGTVDVLNAQGEVLLTVSEMARSALEFVTRTPTFFARELPGDLTDEEKVGLVSTLVEYRLLRVAA
jgi:hypothetical protein